MHARDCSCAPIAVFLYGVRWRHSKPPNSGPHFLVIVFTSLRKDSVANYAPIWTVFSPSVRGMDVPITSYSYIVINTAHV